MAPLAKSPTGIAGLDEITEGGLPQGRPTLIAGNAGCGKTLMGMEFLVKGIQDYGENGVFISFEETADDLVQNVASLGYDLNKLVKQKKLRIDQIKVERSEIEETGDYDLEGLFIRLGYAIDSVNAKRVVLDTIESLFSGFKNTAVLRAELRRLFQWLKDKGVTAIITGERGDMQITRQGLEEYVSDCVILLDHRIENQISTRRLRIVKYRGSTHGTNEYPFLIDKDGITVMPITSMRLDHEVSSRRISSGIKELDVMLGSGFYEGSSILLSGTAGTGKTSVATYFANQNCLLGKKSLYIAFEESPQQIARNAASIGLDIQKQIDSGLLIFESVRSSSQGLEMHLATIYKLVMQNKPSVVVIDPVSTLMSAGGDNEVSAMLSRLLDMLRSQGITSMFTSLSKGGSDLEQTDFGISSFVDTWMLLRDHEVNGERNKLMYVLKSRGTAHSNQVREFVVTDHGIRLVDVYLGSGRILTGSARSVEEARQQIEETEKRLQAAEDQKRLEYDRQVTEARIKSLQARLAMQDQGRAALEQLESQRRDSGLRQTASLKDARAQKNRSERHSVPKRKKL